jgi:hypothetical protein
MTAKMKRPTSIWVAQILLFVFGLIFLAPLFVAVTAVFTPGAVASAAGLALVIAMNLAITVLFAVAFWGMFRRKVYGRWLGFAMLSLTFVLSVIGQVFRPQGPLENVEYTSPGQSAGAVAAQLLMAGLFLLLLYQIAFGKRVIAFFAPAEEPIDVPPPPTFEG